jgi:type I restriction enzyme, S subunit
MKKEKTPNIRFKKFEHNWFKDCLSKVSNSIEYGLNASAKEYDGIHKYLRITDIDESSRLFLTDKLSSPDVNFTIEDFENYKLQKNDLLFARTGASVGKTYLYRESDGEVYYAGFLIRARLRDSYDGNFVFQQTLTDKYKQFIEITSQRSGQPGVNGKEYGEWKIGMTSYYEQSAIGSLFCTLDDLLASYKDNLANYQSLKATMLSKMFPKAGQTVPKIRLDGFEGEWEKYYLGEIFEQVSNYIEPSKENELWSLTVENGLTPKTDRYKRDFLVKKNDKFKKVDVQEFVYNPMNLTLGALDLNDNEVTISVSGYYVVMKNRNMEKFDNDFLKILLKTTYAIYQYKQFATGTLIEKQRVQFPTFSEIPFYLPPIAEQRAIGSYFSNLDNLISAHKEKISQLETLKKKLLQDMFI